MATQSSGVRHEMMTASFQEQMLRYNAAKYLALAQTTTFVENAAMWLKLAHLAMQKADGLEHERTGRDPSQTELAADDVERIDHRVAAITAGFEQLLTRQPELAAAEY